MRTLLTILSALLKYSYLTSGRSTERFSAVTIYALAIPSEWKAHQAGTAVFRQPRANHYGRPSLSWFHSSYWIETVTVPIFNRAGTAKVGGPSTVKLARFSSVLVSVYTANQ